MAKATLISILFSLLLFLAVWLICFSGILDIKELRNLVTMRNSFGVAHNHIRSKSSSLQQSKAQDHQNHNNHDRPLLILHVGPQETGGADLQEFMAQHQDVFQKDNFYFLGHYKHFPELNLDNLYEFCFLSKLKLLRSNCTHEWNVLERKLQQHWEQNHNIILSLERFSAFHEDQDANKHLWRHLDLLAENWNVRVVYTYRRYHEWLAYNYHQMNSTTLNVVDWPGQGGRVIPSFPSAFDQVIQMKSRSPPALLQRWKDHFGTNNVTVFNLHEEGEFIPKFVCTMIPEAANVCNYVTENDVAKPKQGYTDKLRFDMLAVAAYQKGMITDTTLSRQEVTQATEAFADALHYRSWKDYPLVCLTKEQTETLLDMTLEMEQTIMPDFYKKGEKVLRFQFHKYEQQKVFCSIDTITMLQDHRWQEFYQNLQHDPPILQQISTDQLPIDYPDLQVNISFLGIGAQGAGTTWLTDMLRACCPTVSFGKQKEIHFWDWHRMEGLEWYNHMFPKRNKTELLHGEITPHYMALPAEDIAEIYALFPSVKIIFLARDLVDRTWSHIRKGLRHHAHKGDISTSNPANFTDEYFMEIVLDGSHKERSNYDVALRRWYEVFPEEQILLVNFAEIKENPVKLMKEITEFMGVDPHDTNMTAIQEEADQPMNVGAYGSTMRESLREKLESIYRPHARAFNKLLKEHGYSWRLDEYDHNDKHEEESKH